MRSRGVKAIVLANRAVQNLGVTLEELFDRRGHPDLLSVRYAEVPLAPRAREP